MKLDAERRVFLKKAILASAFVARIMQSFSLRELRLKISTVDAYGAQPAP